MKEDFIKLLKELSNTACMPFTGSDIVLVKFGGLFYFFEKNVSPTCGQISPKRPIKGHSAIIPNDTFIRYILRKIYKNGLTYEEYRTRANNSILQPYHYPIVSEEIMRSFSRPPFYYYSIWVLEVSDPEEVYHIIQGACIVPETMQVKNLDETPISEKIMRTLRDFGTGVKEIWNAIFGPKKNGQVPTTAELAEKQLLNCDYIRCGLPPYEKLMLTDPNCGHWDVFENKENEKYGFKARDPKNDINNCVVGIDFGTRSTVVYYRNTANQILPIAVGGGKGGYKSKERYENPTIMHFLSYEKFFKAYKAKEGRPDTKWDDLNVAHRAKDDFLEKAKSVEYCQYLSEIKQWASRSVNIAIEDADGIAKNLPPFLQIEANDFNPIEVYAYYIGLFINRLNPPEKNIYFTYYLSFPVTCEDAVKEKIRISFERGLKKSLPSSLLENEDIMKKFKVICENSEPTAYAVTALKEFGFGKTETDYAVFDFGGGTTDYDFGHWSVLNQKPNINSIESFGGQGIGTCGGENILLDLSFEIFKHNIDITSANGKTYPFLRNSANEGFKGDDIYCPGTSQARKNSRILMEILRPFWENSDLFLNKEDLPPMCKPAQDKENGDIEIQLNLYDTEGEGKAMSIFVNRSDIRDFVKGKVQEAVDGFFAALLGKQDRFHSNDVKIFLAGNSSKSPYVMEIFNERKGNVDNLLLDIYPPLGEDALAKIKEVQPDYQLRDDSPTCKSGVAYGLILLRKGGTIKVIRNVETPKDYKFYIGTDDGDGNFVLLDTIDNPSRKPELNRWYELQQAVDTVFDFYYTDKPAALNENNQLISTSQVRVLSGDEISQSDVDECKTIFIRAISSHRIEYAVADTEENIDERMVKAIDFE
ncbi:MAG: hypothetical protein IKQ70_15720 [Bacteroidales bacterium]|nr:hypothetical protein [Bacteroidales bacterium]